VVDTTIPSGRARSLFARLGRRWFGTAGAAPSTRRRTVRPNLEGLERREVPTVTYNGGAVLPNVEVQNVYYGSDWYNNSTYYQQTGTLENFSKSIVNSSYMDMLNNAGYGVGRGTSTQGTILLANPNKSYYLTDSQIRLSLQSMITNSQVAAPDANRLYVVYVEDNVAVMNDHYNNQTSINNFLGYHMAFAGTDASGHAADIHYAVITYPGGSVGNAGEPGLSAVDSMTVTASHEIAEAVTDPNVNYKALGWYDNQKNGEIGDIVANQYVYLNGYAVQKESDKNDQAMAPAGAAARQRTSFVLLSGGNLWMHTPGGWTNLSSGIASISNQGIDNSGRAMVDVLTTSGVAWEYHEGIGWTKLTSGAKSAVAGSGESYVLMNNGDLWEYQDATGQWQFLDHNVSSMDAGTDRYGVNMVDVVYTNGVAYEHSDTSGWHYLTSGVSQVSAGSSGNTGLVLTNGSAYSYSETSGSFSYLGGATQIAEGTDANGNLMIDLVQNGGTGWEWRSGTGWTQLGSTVRAVSKGRAGVIDVLFQSGSAYEHDANGWTYLTSGVIGVG
jgi:hypothetical protein